MPTGYTSGIEDGKITNFKEYALTCARAFGALIQMRDESFDAPLPKEIIPSPYNAKQLALVKQKMSDTESLSDEEWAALYQDEKVKVESANTNSTAKNAEVSARYSAILKGVEEWEPPSPDHAELKKFMLQQIEISTSHLSPYITIVPAFAEWKDEHFANLKWQIEYYAKHDAEEKERAASRNEWLTKLLESLEI